MLLPNPFVASGMLEDTQLFVGRKDELYALASRMSGVQPTSVNVVGDKRIGKSSLLYHFFLTWEQRVQDSSKYVVIYLSLQNVQCQREENFYLAVAQELLKRPTVRIKQSLTDALQVRPLDRLAFSQAMSQFKTEGLLPVFCLDDFKTLFDNKNEFNNGFYDNLRSLMNSSCLMLIIASQRTLDFYAHRHQLTSSFFNLGHVLNLGELTEEEATDLACLPHTTVPNTQPALGMQEQKLVRQLGGHHPFLLQLAGTLVCEARQQGRDENWVRIQFAQESRRLPRPRVGSSRWWRSILWLIWNLPIRVGSLVKLIGASLDDLGNWVLGIVILSIIILAVFGLVTQSDVLGWIRNLIDKVLGG